MCQLLNNLQPIKMLQCTIYHSRNEPKQLLENVLFNNMDTSKNTIYNTCITFIIFFCHECHKTYMLFPVTFPLYFVYIFMCTQLVTANNCDRHYCMYCSNMLLHTDVSRCFPILVNSIAVYTQNHLSFLSAQCCWAKAKFGSGGKMESWDLMSLFPTLTQDATRRTAWLYSHWRGGLNFNTTSAFNNKSLFYIVLRRGQRDSSAIMLQYVSWARSHLHNHQGGTETQVTLCT